MLVLPWILLTISKDIFVVAKLIKMTVEGKEVKVLTNVAPDLRQSYIDGIKTYAENM